MTKLHRVAVVQAGSNALAHNRIGGAALDAFEEESLPADSRLRQFLNVILMPHAAWYSAESALRVQALAADEVHRHVSGRPARCPTTDSLSKRLPRHKV